MNCSTLGLPVHHQLLEFTQTHVHWVGVAIQPSHPLLSPSPPALSLSQHQGLLKCVSSLHQVAKVLEFQQKPVCYCHSSFICNSNKLERARILCSRCMVKTAVLHPQGSSASSPQEVAVVHWWGQTKSPKLRIPRGHALCCSRVGSGGLWLAPEKVGHWEPFYSEDLQILLVVEEWRNISTCLKLLAFTKVYWEKEGPVRAENEEVISKT